MIAHRLPDDWERTLRALGCWSCHLGARGLKGRTVARVKDAGYRVATFTVNRAERARALIAEGVDCVITDSPEVILPALA